MAVTNFVCGLDFPQLFASAKQGWAGSEPSRKDGQGMEELFDLILDYVPPPASAAPERSEAPFSMLVTLLESDPFLGRILTGRIESGTVRPNQNFKAINLDGEKVDSARVSKVLAFRGLERVSVDAASAGDIVALAGFSRATVSDTLCDPSLTTPIPADAVDPPTIAVTFLPNDSPFSGQDGDKVQSRVIRERLLAEAEGNVRRIAQCIGDGCPRKTSQSHDITSRGGFDADPFQPAKSQNLADARAVDLRTAEVDCLEILIGPNRAAFNPPGQDTSQKRVRFQ